MDKQNYLFIAGPGIPPGSFLFGFFLNLVFAFSTKLLSTIQLLEGSLSVDRRLLYFFAVDYKFLKITDFRYLVDTLKMYL